ncbi:hypothetical protein Daura_26105 [Dactylosporangium aurantiacum]|uniref:Uncharacterized protein n=1 Tax=Dactylosporangium aurantiacum TaxID=35754 RepID=A0A9Q9MF62_9ACTN|nr:hypothetical protein [Dactylosporangium aurantiacum]MDG6109227.1 hypothetical protein [Dactylosporangium aurantiacum]UWZ50321.1 hypothetical protein Daura_26105 [Dactylosporangium aurantiacum]
MPVPVPVPLPLPVPLPVRGAVRRRVRMSRAWPGYSVEERAAQRCSGVHQVARAQ